jgi:hypothetical protein
MAKLRRPAPLPGRAQKESRLMATLLIGTEVAEGMGHVAPWRDFCALAQKANHAVHMAGPDVGLLHERIASRLPVTLWSAPCGKPLPHHPPAKSWPELLASLGYAQPHWLSGAALAWAAVLDAVQPDAVLCDYAPALMLACQALGVRYLEAGGGFCVPPIYPDGSMPPFPGVQKHNQETTAEALERLSKALLSAARALSSDRTTAASATWTELHTHAAHRLVTSPPWLDHYETRDPTVAPVTHVGFLGLGDALAPDTENSAVRLVARQQPEPQHPATHIVGYLKPNTPDLGTLLAELASAGLPTQIYCPGYAGPAAIPAGITISNTALNLNDQLNPGAIFVTNGGLASVGLALQKRSRLLLAPQQPEQVAMARRLHKLGLGAVALPGRVGVALEGFRQGGVSNRDEVYPLQSRAAEEEVLCWALDEQEVMP